MGIKTGDKILRNCQSFGKHLIGARYARAEADHFVTCFPEDQFDVEEILNDIVNDIGQLNIQNQIKLFWNMKSKILIFLSNKCDRAA